MKNIIALSAAALTVGCMAERPMEMSAEAQSRLAEELAGRVEGPTQHCVSRRDLRGNRSVGEDAIIFEGRSRATIYVNRPRGGCPSLDQGRALLIRSPSPQLCAGEIATVFDPVSGIEFGSCGLGEFTEYRRPL